jgi:hypothetical protein
MPCNVCQHNQVKDIDRALLSGVTLTSLSQTYGFSTQALRCHQEQLRQKMALADKRFHDGLRQGLYLKLNLVMEMVLGVVRGARAGEDFKLFLQASREFTRIVNLMLKMDVHLEPELIYCLMASPQWDLQDSLLPNSFQALAQTRQTLKVNLYAPCPEPALETTPETVVGSPLETQNLKPDTPPAHQGPDRLSTIAPAPARPQANQTITGNWQTSENPARN